MDIMQRSHGLLGRIVALALSATERSIAKLERWLATRSPLYVRVDATYRGSEARSSSPPAWIEPGSTVEFRVEMRNAGRLLLVDLVVSQHIARHFDVVSVLCRNYAVIDEAIAASSLAPSAVRRPALYPVWVEGPFPSFRIKVTNTGRKRHIFKAYGLVRIG